MYEQVLQDLGLTQNEVKVYLSLIENGALNPTSISQKTGMHRSYIYDTLERLQEKGMVNTILIENKKHYQPISPNVLRESFELKLKQLNTVIPELTKLFQANKKQTTVELHTGKRVYKTLIKEIIANAKENDTVYLQGADESLLENVEPIYLKQYLNIIKSNNIQEKIIIAKGKKQLKQKNLQYKEINPEYLDETTTVIFQDSVFIFTWGNPHHLIKIEDSKVANTYKKQFNLIWDLTSST